MRISQSMRRDGSPALGFPSTAMVSDSTAEYRVESTGSERERVAGGECLYHGGDAEVSWMFGCM